MNGVEERLGLRPKFVSMELDVCPAVHTLFECNQQNPFCTAVLPKVQMSARLARLKPKQDSCGQYRIARKKSWRVQGS